MAVRVQLVSIGMIVHLMMPVLPVQGKNYASTFGTFYGESGWFSGGGGGGGRNDNNAGAPNQPSTGGNGGGG